MDPFFWRALSFSGKFRLDSARCSKGLRLACLKANARKTGSGEQTTRVHLDCKSRCPDSCTLSPPPSLPPSLPSFLPPSLPRPFLPYTAAQVELFVALCKALPHLGALRSLELEGLSKAFEKVAMNACYIPRARNSHTS